MIVAAVATAKESLIGNQSMVRRSIVISDRGQSQSSAMDHHYRPLSSWAVLLSKILLPVICPDLLRFQRRECSSQKECDDFQTVSIGRSQYWACRARWL